MKRLRRAIKILGPIRVPIASVAGVMLTLFAAWWFALEPRGVIPFPHAWTWEQGPGDLQYFTQSAEPENLVWTRMQAPGADLTLAFTRDDESLRQLVENYQASAFEISTPPGWSIALNRIRAGEFLTEDVFGWPFRCLRQISIKRTDGTRDRYSSLDLPMWLRTRLLTSGRLPIDPLLGPFLLNTLFYAAITYPIISIPACISGLRRRLTNHCHRCGYSLDGLTADACPECGDAIQRPKGRATTSVNEPQP